MQIGVGTKDQRGEASLAAEEQIRGLPPARAQPGFLSWAMFTIQQFGSLVKREWIPDFKQLG